VLALHLFRVSCLVILVLLLPSSLAFAEVIPGGDCHKTGGTDIPVYDTSRCAIGNYTSDGCDVTWDGRWIDTFACDGNGTRLYLHEWTDYTEPYSCSCSGGESCFLPGTQIQTPDGQVSIEAVKSQDKVLSLDPLSGQLYENIVSALHISAQDHYYTITTASGAKVQVTDEHPFYTGIRSTLAKSLPQKASATLSSLYIYLQDGWHVVVKNAAYRFKMATN
jgi:hypothetical protein